MIPLLFTLVSIFEIDKNCDCIPQKFNVSFLNIQMLKDSRRLNAILQRNSRQQSFGDQQQDKGKEKEKRNVKALQSALKKIQLRN